jgi:hypothetical protein
MNAFPALRRAAASLFLFALGFDAPAEAWDSGGHEIVAVIAYDQLNAKAREAVDRLAPQMQNPDRIYDAITISCWMDDLKKNPAMPDHGKFLSWHYIDIPIDARDPMPSFEPGTDNDVHGNAVQALKRAMVVLKGGTDPYVKDPAMALALIEHLVGDLHQPLHCATKYFFSHGVLRDDKGGNEESVVNGPADPKFNLHAFWDSAWRASFDPASGDVVLDPEFQVGGTRERQSLRTLAEAIEHQPLPAGADIETNFDDWARESNAVARDFVYPEITATDNRKYCRLSSGYVDRARDIARQRLELAGYRLATLLNETLGAEKAPAVPPPYPAGPPAQPY